MRVPLLDVVADVSNKIADGIDEPGRTDLRVKIPNQASMKLIQEVIWV